MKKLSRIPFTQEGLDKIKKEYSQLSEIRKEAVATLKAARELGDLSENGLYKAARARLTSIDHTLARLSLQIKLADVVESHAGVVGIGSKVTAHIDSQTVQYTIVGDLEASPKEKKVSQLSPIGRAFMGKHVGDSIEINTPAGKKNFIIMKIETFEKS